MILKPPRTVASKEEVTELEDVTNSITNGIVNWRKRQLIFVMSARSEKEVNEGGLRLGWIIPSWNYFCTSI